MRFRSAIGSNLFHLRGIRRWAKAARRAPEMGLDELRSTRSLARKYLYSMSEVLAVADSRLALPSIDSNAFPKPHGTDWAWRPSLWRRPLPVPGMSSVESKSKLGTELTLFHDCAHTELTLRQLRNHREADLAMTRLFGGFETAFYRAYLEEWPLRDGHEEREPMYQLYHLLNHLNLFGSGYYAQCERILRHYAD